jgi:spermidine/putrescine-binding protein
MASGRAGASNGSWISPKESKTTTLFFNRGNTRNLGLLAEAKVAMNCGMYIHPMSRLLKKQPALPIKMVVPDPFPVTFHDPQAIFAGAKNPHAALLWLEFLAAKELKRSSMGTSRAEVRSWWMAI